MSTAMNAMRTGPRRVVHLELHTGDQVRAGAFYAELLQWRPELGRAGSSCYLAVDLGPAVGGGITECQARRPLWLPYAEVGRIDDATEHARRLGAAVLLEPREGPSGWRSVIIPVVEVSSFAANDVLDVPGKPRAVHTPGHTPGNAALYFADQDALISGDTVITRNPLTGRAGPQICPPGSTATPSKLLTR